MKFTNIWKKTVEIDEINICLKLSFLTILELKADWSTKEFTFTILNFKFSKK